MGCATSSVGDSPIAASKPDEPAGLTVVAQPAEPSRLRSVAPPGGFRLCKNSCGRKVQDGVTKGGQPFVTCCRACALSPAKGRHDDSCAGPAAVESCARPVCPKGARCRSREAAHLAAQAHPLDKDYAACCREAGIEAQALSLKIVFDWADADGSGKLTRQELQDIMPVIFETMEWDDPEDFPPLTAAAWDHLDEDGNGVINFSEFASWAGPRLGLPLGLRRSRKDSKGSCAGTEHATACTVLGCPCLAYCEPCTVLDQIGLSMLVAEKRCKTCKHKQRVHRAQVELESGEVDFPAYWTNRSGGFNTQVACGKSEVHAFQSLVDQTYLNRWTRDRKRHHPDNPNVPSGFRVVSVSRNENSGEWSEYYARRFELLTKIREGMCFDVIDKVKTNVAWSTISAEVSSRLMPECNEWYLFHGTSPEAARAICSTDFKVATAGSNTGTLYGRGLYFAESITKADEYAKRNEAGCYAVLLCRVLGGRVLYTSEVKPDPEGLVFQCLDGPFDCILGDREKCKGTFREFVLFDSEDVMPEYVIEYTRVYS